MTPATRYAWEPKSMGGNIAIKAPTQQLMLHYDTRDIIRMGTEVDGREHDNQSPYTEAHVAL